jgi:hypothetical protein
MHKKIKQVVFVAMKTGEVYVRLLEDKSCILAD